MIEGNVVWRTVAKEGLEISVSSHFVNPNKMKNKLMEFERAYTKETLLPNSSEMRLTEHQSDVPDLLPTQGNNVSSVGKDTQSSNNEQGSSVKNAESDAIPTDEEVGFTQSNSVLQGEEVDNSRGDNESQEQGTAVQAGSKGEVENGLVHQGAQGGVENTKQPLFEYFKGGIKSLIEESKKQGSGLVKAIVANISDKLKADLRAHGIDITDDFKHILDNNAIKHALNRHGSEKERLQGQLPITEEDIENVSDVINNYNEINIEENKCGQKNIVYKKSYPNGTTLYIEEVRTGRKELAMASIRKKATRTDANSKATPISDLNNLSADKDKQSSATKQVNEDKSTPTAKKTEEDRVSKQVKNYNILLKKSAFGVEKFNFINGQMQEKGGFM